MIGKDWPGGNVCGSEFENVFLGAESFQKCGQILRGLRGVKAHQADRGAFSEDRDHDRFIIDRIHENVAAIALMKESVELHFADPAGQLARGRK